jgi:hypothetical protein
MKDVENGWGEVTKVKEGVFTLGRGLKMTKLKWILSSFVAIGLGLFLFLPPSWSQGNGTSLTLLYSNNINGEIDPCPS